MSPLRCGIVSPLLAVLWLSLLYGTVTSQLPLLTCNVADRLTQLETRLTQQQKRLDAIQDLLKAVMPVRDCTDLPAGTKSGVYLLQPGLGRPVPAYCDMDTDGGGWTVFQRRADIKPRQDFFLGWYAYKWGFGKLDAEFWWGLEHLWLTTSLLDRRYQLLINMEDFDGTKKYALYQNFKISPEEDNYRLTLNSFAGNAGDSLTRHSGSAFSTKGRDHDTDKEDCAQLAKGAWWYEKCHSSNLNGLYLAGKHSSYGDGIHWYTWKGYHYSLKTVEMKLKPMQTS